MSRKVKERQHAVKSGRPERTAVGDAFSELAVHVLRLAGVLGAEGDALAAPFGQSSARWRVLAAVEVEPMSVAQIAHALGLARQSVQRLADSLVAARLATYEDNPSHRRAKLLRLSPQGRRVLASIQDAQREWADALGAAIGERELARGNAILERVLRALTERTAER